jgi:hypothetical protein
MVRRTGYAHNIPVGDPRGGKDCLGDPAVEASRVLLSNLNKATSEDRKWIQLTQSMVPRQAL